LKPANTGIRRVIKAFGYSIMGISAAWKNEAAFRQEVMGCLILVPAAIWLGDTAVEVALLLMTLLMVLVVELLNSAVEAVVDRFGGELHELSGNAKDMGSAAVLLSIVIAIIVWLVIIIG